MSMTFTMENAVSQAQVVADANSAALTSDWLSMAGHDHICFLIHIHTHGAASTITVANAATNAGGSTADIAFKYRLTATASTDDWGSLTAATSAGVATDGSTTNQLYAIEIDAAELTDGMDFVQVKMSDPGAAMLVSMIGIASRGKVKAASGVSIQS